jgi:hypothetical protein
MTSHQDKSHPSRIDWRFGVLWAVGPLGCINLGIYLHKANNNTWGAVCMLSGMLSGICVWLLKFPCQYTLGNDQLMIQSGLLRKYIPYAEINSFEPMSNQKKSPALSLNRICIQHGKKSTCISPIELDQFILKLQEKVNQSKA